MRGVNKNIIIYWEQVNIPISDPRNQLYLQDITTVWDRNRIIMRQYFHKQHNIFKKLQLFDVSYSLSHIMKSGENILTIKV